MGLFYKQLVGLSDYQLELTLSDKSKKIIPYVQGCNLVFSNTKQPIWGFSKEEFQQIARGKKLVEGTIVFKHSQLSFLSKITEEEYKDLENVKKTKAFEERASRYSNAVKPYIEGMLESLVDNQFDKNTSERVETSLVMALKLLNYGKSIGLTLTPANDDTKKYGVILTNVTFTELQNQEEVAKGSGNIVLKFFSSWTFDQ